MKPDSIVKTPAMGSALYGVIPMIGESRIFNVIVDLDKKAPSDFYVDSNGNGDLTDGPRHVWTEEPKIGLSRRWEGSFALELGNGVDAMTATIGEVRSDGADPVSGKVFRNILYFPDYAYTGLADFGGDRLQVALVD